MEIDNNEGEGEIVPTSSSTSTSPSSTSTSSTSTPIFSFSNNNNNQQSTSSSSSPPPLLPPLALLNSGVAAVVAAAPIPGSPFKNTGNNGLTNSSASLDIIVEQRCTSPQPQISSINNLINNSLSSSSNSLHSNSLHSSSNGIANGNSAIQTPISTPPLDSSPTSPMTLNAIIHNTINGNGIGNGTHHQYQPTQSLSTPLAHRPPVPTLPSLSSVNFMSQQQQSQQSQQQGQLSPTDADKKGNKKRKSAQSDAPQVVKYLTPGGSPRIFSPLTPNTKAKQQLDESKTHMCDKCGVALNGKSKSNLNKHFCKGSRQSRSSTGGSNGSGSASGSGSNTPVKLTTSGNNIINTSPSQLNNILNGSSNGIGNGNGNTMDTDSDHMSSGANSPNINNGGNRSPLFGQFSVSPSHDTTMTTITTKTVKEQLQHPLSSPPLQPQQQTSQQLQSLPPLPLQQPQQQPIQQQLQPLQQYQYPQYPQQQQQQPQQTQQQQQQTLSKSNQMIQNQLPKSKDMEEIYGKLVDLIVEHELPLAIVESKSFLELLQSSSQYRGPILKLTKSELKDEINQRYRWRIRDLQKELDIYDWLSVTSDGWNTNDKFSTITVRGFTNTTNSIKTYFLTCDLTLSNRDPTTTQQLVESTLSDYGLTNRILYYITNSDSDCLVGSTIDPIVGSDVCFIHLLNQCHAKFIESEQVCQLLQLCHDISSYFHQSQFNQLSFIKYQLETNPKETPKKLKNWKGISTLDLCNILERIILLKDTLINYFQQIQDDKEQQELQPNFKVTKESLDDIEMVYRVSKVFEGQISMLKDKQKTVALGDVIPVVNTIAQELAHYEQDAPNLINANHIVGNLVSRYTSSMASIHLLATYLNHTHRQQYVVPHLTPTLLQHFDQMVRAHYTQIKSTKLLVICDTPSLHNHGLGDIDDDHHHHSIIDDDDDDSDQSTSLMDELTSLQRSDNKDAKFSDMSPLKWWIDHKREYPCLFKIATNLLSIPIISVDRHAPVERTGSKKKTSKFPQRRKETRQQ
ncbi:hypothetical protein DFA_07146 [Cavenderia fasciculata]|uniref:HAT C-terminal dimerisation domain-containing protein n=1 Tax=Cavenderia fasciculata TaxID=261658 RepID=F4PVL6_CACFS|nr:uncharacterized protein DFA_07146 [Cavenderia fasciculata]EGG20030.1 hypothetical protein DFA_07146 [Cavenderia fasciculata]|eukprot:XP_004367013.1 hypothetical protein DFA_07146 [Cavenderia fasciculata]